jgi:hypothetical protein
MSLTYDDTLPLPEEVEQEFYNKTGHDKEALAWLSDRDFQSAPQHAALIQYGMVWTPEKGRYRFVIYPPSHIGPKYPPELAIPIIEHGVFVDLLFVSDEMSFARATCRAHWLGSKNLACRWCDCTRTRWTGLKLDALASVISSRLAERR